MVQLHLANKGSAVPWEPLCGKASITVKTISMVGELERLIDTTIMIIFYRWTTFHAVIGNGYSGGRSQAERKKKESETRERDDGLIERIQISIFSEEVGRDRSPQERREERGSETMEVAKRRLRDWDKNRRKKKLRDGNTVATKTIRVWGTKAPFRNVHFTL